MRGIFVEKIDNLTIFKVGKVYRVLKTSKRKDYRVFEAGTLDECRNFIELEAPYGMTIARAEALEF